MRAVVMGLVSSYNNGQATFVSGSREADNSQQQTQAYSAAPVIDVAAGGGVLIVPTDGVAFVLGAPTFRGLAMPAAMTGFDLYLTVKNTFGVLGAMTFNAVFKSPAWVQPANGFSRTVTWSWNGTNWIETFRSAADVPN